MNTIKRYTRDQVRSFAEESIDYVAGSATLDEVLSTIGAIVADSTGLGSRIDKMHSISDSFTLATLDEARNIMNEYNFIF